MSTSAPKVATNSIPVVIQNSDTKAQQGHTLVAMGLGGAAKDERPQVPKAARSISDVAGIADRWGLNEF
jgi:hypothetical protein